ncbi:MAG: hypothetical protein KDK30_15580 [Leptospiraceae bacterium]|nr:hypothetical protein [Leptospiraceae bacterium]MCB1320875.1 hypothetical protein [Leptospiraceae bacterium]
MAENKKEQLAPTRFIQKGNGKVVNLNYYRIRKSLREEGFDLVDDHNGKLKLVLRMPRG